MRAIVIGMLAAAALAVVAATILDAGLQRSAQDKHQTEGVRL